MSYADENTSLGYRYSTINDRPRVSLGEVLGLGGLGATIEEYTPGELTNMIIDRILQINIDLKFIRFKISTLFPAMIQELMRPVVKNHVDSYMKDKLELAKPEKINKLIDIILNKLEADVRGHSASQIGSEYATMIDGFWINILTELGGEGGVLDDLGNAGSMFTNQWSIIADKAPMSFVYALFTKSNTGPLRNTLLTGINAFIGSPIPGWLIGDTVGAMKGKIKEELIKIMNSLAERFGVKEPLGATIGNEISAWIEEYVNKTAITLPVDDWWKVNQGKVLTELLAFIRRRVGDLQIAMAMAVSQMPKISNLFLAKATTKIFTLHQSNPQVAIGLAQELTQAGPGMKVFKEPSANILPILAVAGLAALYLIKNK